MVSNVIGVTCVQFLQHRIPDFQLSTCRYGAQLLMAVIFARFTGSTFRVPLQFYGWVAALTVAHVTFNTALYGGAGLIPLTAFKSTYDLSQLIAVAVLSYFVCKRSVGKIQILAAVICIAGMIMVLQPRLISEDHTSR